MNRFTRSRSIARKGEQCYNGVALRIQFILKRSIPAQLFISYELIEQFGSW